MFASKPHHWYSSWRYGLSSDNIREEEEGGKRKGWEERAREVCGSLPLDDV
jgi:hypothetical protein